MSNSREYGRLPHIGEGLEKRCTPSLRLQKAMRDAPAETRLTLLATDPMARIDVPHLLAGLGGQVISIDETDGFGQPQHARLTAVHATHLSAAEIAAFGRAGATAVGARKPLVAFNTYLRGTDEEAAKEIAREVRESAGGLPAVRAIGFAVPERGCVTVSMNLVDTEQTALHEAAPDVLEGLHQGAPVTVAGAAAN